MSLIDTIKYYNRYKLIVIRVATLVPVKPGLFFGY